MFKNNICIEKQKLGKLNLFFPGKKVKWKKANFFLQSSLWKLWKKSSYEVKALIMPFVGVLR